MLKCAWLQLVEVEWPFNRFGFERVPLKCDGVAFMRWVALISFENLRNEGKI